MIEKIVCVKTLVTKEGYKDEVETRGFTPEESQLQNYYKRTLIRLNRVLLRKSESLEMKSEMSYTR